MNICKKVFCGFLVARCDAPEVFDCTEEAPDKIALGIKRKVKVTLRFGLRDVMDLTLGQRDP